MTTEYAILGDIRRLINAEYANLYEPDFIEVGREEYHALMQAIANINRTAWGTIPVPREGPVTLFGLPVYRRHNKESWLQIRSHPARQESPHARA